MLSTSLPLAPLSWTSVGPAPIGIGGSAYSGRITGIAADPGNANVIYIAAAGGGVWKTVNSGTSWLPLTDNLSDTSGNPIPTFMGAITVDPLNANVIYAGTGEANYSGDSFYGRGILKSIDGGASWTLQDDGGVFNRYTIAKIVVDPTNDNNVYAAVSTGVNGSFGKTGIYRSGDGGTTWANTTAAISTNQDYTDLVIDPNTPNTLYLAVGSGSAIGGVYKTTDAGGTWNLLTGGGSIPTGATNGRTTLAISTDSSTLYVSISGSGNGNVFGDVYKMLRSTDGGNSFTDLTATTPAYFGGSGIVQGWYDTTLAVQPGNANVVFAGGSDNGGGIGLIESTNGGATWSAITVGGGVRPHTDHHAMAFDANGKLLDGDDGGVYRLNNATPGPTLQWVDLNANLDLTQFTGIALDPTNPNIAYGGSQDNGTEKFNDVLGWNQIFGGDGGFTRVDPFNPATIYQERNGISLSRSDDAGITFTNISAGLSGFANFYPPYILDPSTSGRVLFGSDSLFESLDKGVTWSAIGTPNVKGFNTNDNSIDAIAVAPSDPKTIYVAAGGDLYVTSNGTSGAATTWTKINIAGFGSFNYLAVDPLDPKTAYVVRSAFSVGTPFAAPGSGGHVFKTINLGASWTDISASLPNIPTDSIILDPRGTTAARVLYAGTDAGVYSSQDSGTTWTKYLTGIANAQVVEMDIAPNLGILGAGTHGRGLFENQFFTTLIKVVGGNLVITDIAQGVQNDSLTIQANTGTSQYIITDPNNSLGTIGIPGGFTSTDGHTATVPFAVVTGTVNINTAAGNDSVTLDFSAGSFPKPVSYDGGIGVNLLTLRNGSFATETITPSGAAAGAITLPAQSITFANLNTVSDVAGAASVTLNATGGADKINVVNGPLVIGTKTTQVNSGNASFAQLNFANKTNVTLQGLGGADTFVLNNPTPAVGLTSFSAVGGATAGVVFNIQATASALATSVVGGGNAVTVNVGNAGSTQGILGVLSLTNSAGALNAVTLDDSADTITLTATLGSSTIQGFSPAAVTFQAAGTQSLTLKGGTAGNFFNVQATGIATTINGGTGSDTFNVFPQTAASTLILNGQNPVVAPGDVLVYNGPGTLVAGIPGSGTLSQTAQGTVSFTSIETVNVGASLTLSTLTITPSVVLLGTTATVTLKTVDAAGAQETGGGLTVGFILGNGAGNDSIGPVTDNHDGTYTATFTGLTVSTTTITATIGTQPTTSTPANVTVNLGNFSLTQSTVTINPASIQSGATANVTLNGRDINGNPGPNGFPVIFKLGSGAATGTFSATTDNHDGSYTAIFTGALKGTNTITAFVGGLPITSAPPTVTVTLGPVSLLQSTVVVNPPSLLVGATTSAVLTTRDYGGNQETGGLAVAFTLGVGVGNGTFGSVTDNADGTYSTVFTGTAAGTNTVSATIGGLALTSAAPTVTVQQAPAIISPNTATFVESAPGSFTVTTTGVPTPTVTESGPLPAGLTLNSATGIFSGTPAPGTSGTYQLILTAANGVGANATQPFTLIVIAAPVFTSAPTTTFLVGSAGSFTVTASGLPTPTLSVSSKLPTGLSFDPTTGILSGTPAAGTAGIVPLTFTAVNSLGTANQSFTLTIDAAPVFISAPGTTFVVNNPGTFTVATNAFPAATLSESGTLPRGVTFNAVTGVLSGTPANGTSGVYLLTFTATNGIGVDAVQNFTLTVSAAPVLLGGKLVHFTASVAGSYKIPVSGVPAPTFSEVGALPTGITLDPVNGVFSGTPARASAGNYAVTITATNSGGSATQQLTLIVAPATGPQPAAYDKLGAYRSSDGSWSEDSDGTAGFNAATDQTFMHFSPGGVTGVAGDWLGVGRDTIGDFSNGVWHLDLNGNGILDPGETFHFGQAGDRPIVGDWDGNGRSELGVFRTATDGVSGEFILDFANHKALDASNQAFNFGLTTDRPVIGDWNGDGKSKVGVVRDAAAYGAPGAALFTLDTINYHRFDARSQIFVFGRITDGIVIGDWNGDGVSKVGVYRDGSAGYNAPGVALFSLDTNNNHHFETGIDPVFLYGYTTDQFVAGNWETTPPVLPAEFAAGGQGPGGAPTLTTAQLTPVLQQAIADWTAHGASESQLAAVQVRIGSLDGALVGWSSGNVITLDTDAAGWGWSTDLSTPQAGKIDLLTVVEHELGHELGLSDVDASSHRGDLMASTLPTGTRRSIK